jgi:hypothetical protein
MNTTPVFAPVMLLVSLCTPACSSSEAPSPEPTSPVTESNALSPPIPRATETSASTPLIDPTDKAAVALDAGYFSCSTDNDCVAVPYIPRCCYNGWKIAVARSEAAAFVASERCEDKHVICPFYMVDDLRVPACNSEKRECEMVPRDAGAASAL